VARLPNARLFEKRENTLPSQVNTYFEADSAPSGMNKICVLLFAPALIASPTMTHQNVPSSKHDELTPHIDVKLFPSEQVIHPGETLKLKIEIWNVGPQDILLHKGFLRVRTSMQA